MKQLVVYVQAKAKSAADGSSKNKRKVLEQQQQAESAKEEVPQLQARSKELQEDLEAATAHLASMQESIKGEVCVRYNIENEKEQHQGEVQRQSIESERKHPLLVSAGLGVCLLQHREWRRTAPRRG